MLMSTLKFPVSYVRTREPDARPVKGPDVVLSSRLVSGGTYTSCRTTYEDAAQLNNLMARAWCDGKPTQWHAATRSSPSQYFHNVVDAPAETMSSHIVGLSLGSTEAATKSVALIGGAKDTAKGIKKKTQGKQYYCDYPACNTCCATSKSLAKHKQRVHTNFRYACPRTGCRVFSKRADKLKEHLRMSKRCSKATLEDLRRKGIMVEDVEDLSPMGHLTLYARTVPRIGAP